MADLIQLENQKRIYMGWYGSCDDVECVGFDLTDNSVVYDIIDSVYEIDSDSTTPRGFHSSIGMGHSQRLNGLTCGHAYYIALKKGIPDDLKTLSIPEFTWSNTATSEQKLLTDECSGSSSVSISYLPNKPSDNGDLRISIGVDITELNNLCSSNIWKYKIEKLTDESASSGTVIENYTEAFSEANQVTLESKYLSEEDGGNSWYLVSIIGLASDKTTPITDIVTAKVFIAWPKPVLTINDNDCASFQSHVAETNEAKTGSIPVCDTLSVDYLEFDGPSDNSTRDKATGPAVFNLERYLIADDSLSMTATITDAGSAQDNFIFGYKLGTTGGYNTFTESQTINISDNNKISVVLNNTDGDGAKLTADNYSIKLTFEFQGKDDSYAPNFDKYKVDVVVNAQVKEREVSIVSLTDDDALGIDLQINRTNVTRWRYKLYIDPDGANTLLHEDNTSTFRTGDNLKIPITPTELPAMYKVVVYGVSDVNSDVVTPEVSQNIQMGWPPYKLEISDTINEGYEEESGPSRGNDTLTVVHNWITEYTFSMPDNTDGAWEIKRNGETDDKYITIPTTPTSFLTRNDQTSMSADVSDIYILRLKAGLSAGNYNRNLILNGTAKDSSVVTQKSTSVNGIVSVKPPCCDGFVAGNTVLTKGNGVNVEPVTGNGGVAVWTVDFDDGGKLCFPSGVSGSTPTIYLVDLYDDENNKIEGWSPTMPYGQVWVVGAFTSTDAVYEHPNGTCYIGNLTKSDPDIMQFKDPGRNEGATLFGENDG